jgi:hypothetical protein
MNRRTNKSRKEREREFGFPKIPRTSLPGSKFSENKFPRTNALKIAIIIPIKFS